MTVAATVATVGVGVGEEAMLLAATMVSICLCSILRRRV